MQFALLLSMKYKCGVIYKFECVRQHNNTPIDLIGMELLTKRSQTDTNVQRSACNYVWVEMSMLFGRILIILVDSMFVGRDSMQQYQDIIFDWII